MLARYMLWPGVCLSVCLSVYHELVFCRNGCVDRAGFFRTESGPVAYPIVCYNRIQVPSKNNGTALWNLVPNSELCRFFCLCSPLHVDRSKWLSHWASSIVYNTWPWRQSRTVHLRQLRLLNFPLYSVHVKRPGKVFFVWNEKNGFTLMTVQLVLNNIFPSGVIVVKRSRVKITVATTDGRYATPSFSCREPPSDTSIAIIRFRQIITVFLFIICEREIHHFDIGD